MDKWKNWKEIKKIRNVQKKCTEFNRQKDNFVNDQKIDKNIVS